MDTDFAMVINNDSSAKSSRRVQERVGKKLKQVYADVAAEPIPDRFLDLIKQLESDNTTNSDTPSSNKEKDKR